MYLNVDAVCAPPMYRFPPEVEIVLYELSCLIRLNAFYEWPVPQITSNSHLGHFRVRTNRRQQMQPLSAAQLTLIHNLPNFTSAHSLEVRTNK